MDLLHSCIKLVLPKTKFTSEILIFFFDTSFSKFLIPLVRSHLQSIGHQILWLFHHIISCFCYFNFILRVIATVLSSATSIKGPSKDPTVPFSPLNILQDVLYFQRKKSYEIIFSHTLCILNIKLILIKNTLCFKIISVL